MLRRSSISLSFFFLFFSFTIAAQFRDSLHSYLRKRPGITGGIGSVQSFFYGFKAPITYATIGASFAGRLRIGGGYCKLSDPSFDGDLKDDQQPFYRNYYFTNPGGWTDTTVGKLRFEYMMYFIEYVFYKTKKWSFSVPVRFGLGRTRYTYTYLGEGHAADKHLMFVYHPSVSFDYAIFRWLGFNTELGYKFTVINFRNIRENFNSPVYNVGFFLYYSEIYKMMFPHSKWAKLL
jgi:hypothetical protein